jgi:hypothetical protein
VKNRLFGRRLLLTFNINIMAFQLKNLTDEKIGVEHVQGGNKYLPHLALSQVMKVLFNFLLPPTSKCKYSGASWCDRTVATKWCRATVLKITLSRVITFLPSTTSSLLKKRY